MPESQAWIGYVIIAFVAGLGISYVAFNHPISNTPQANFSMEFDSTKYVVNHIGKISISDKHANSDASGIDKIRVNVTSTSDPVGFQTMLNETGPNTGMFTGNFIFTANTIPSTNSIQSSTGDIVTVSYGSVSLVSEIKADTGAGAYATSILPLVMDPEILYPESYSAIRVYDSVAYSTQNTVTAHISSTADSIGFDVVLSKDTSNVGTFHSNNILFTTGSSRHDGQTNLALKIPTVPTVNAVTATYGSNVAHATVQLAPVPQSTTTPSATTGLVCDSYGDKDNDGICDSWETPTGLSITGSGGATFSVQCNPFATLDPSKPIPTDLPTPTSPTFAFYNPIGDLVCPQNDVPDVYVQVSWMQGHQPNATALSNVVQQFLHAPVVSWDNTPGIHLHLLVDKTGMQHVDSIPLDGSVTHTIGFRQLKDQQFMTPDDRQSVGCSSSITNCETEKRQVFHYAMFIHELSDTPGSSGWGEIGGNDFIVSLGDNFIGQVGSVNQQAGTFMHELGHNLNLNHGGPGSSSFNCKPVDLSIMNYLYQFNAASGGFMNTRPLDYSEVRVTYDETQLNEQTGIAAINNILLATPNPQHIVIGGVTTAGSQFSPMTVATGGPVDFNQNGGTTFVPETTSYAQNTHYFGIPDCTDTSIRIMGGFNEWASLNFNFKDSSFFADGVYTRTSTTPDADNYEHEITSQTVQKIFNYTGIPLSSRDPPASIHFYADADYASTPANTTVTIPVLANDSNTGVSVTITSQGAKGSAVVNTDNTVTYTPQDNVLGPDFFTYEISNGSGHVADATVHVNITNTDTTTPTAAPQLVSTNENTAKSIILTATDPDNTSFTFAISNNPSHGDLGGFNPVTGKVTYTPNTNYSGSDSFTFTASDGTNTSSAANVTITVASGDTTAPTLAINPIAPIPVNTPVIVTGNASDASSGVANVKVKLDSNPYIVANGTTNWSANIGLVPVGTHSLTVNATDNSGNSAVQTVMFSPNYVALQLDKLNYFVNDTINITVNDAFANTDNSQHDSISVHIISNVDPVGLVTILEETGSNTGIFVGNVALTELPTSQSGSHLEVHPGVGDTIGATYKGITVGAKIH